MAERKGSSYIRLRRHETPIVYKSEDDFQFGSANKLNDGSDLTIPSYSETLEFAIRAVKELERGGLEATLRYYHIVKPFDSENLEKAARQTGAIVTMKIILLWAVLREQAPNTFAKSTQRSKQG